MTSKLPRETNAASFRRPGWIAVRQRVSELLPAGARHLPDPSTLTPDNLCAAAEETGATFQFVSLPSSWRDSTCGQPHWEEWGRLELYDEVFGQLPPAPGELWFVPPECLRRDVEPYLVRGDELRTHVATRPFFVFDGDALFVWTESPRITVFHHEGGYAHIDCATAGEDPTS